MMKHTIKINPTLLERAALIRFGVHRRTGINSYYPGYSTPTSASLMSAAETTNTFVLAYGEKEGLGPGERLEIYGDRMRLVKTLAFGYYRGAPTRSHLLEGCMEKKDLDEITREINRIKLTNQMVLEEEKVLGHDDEGKQSAWQLVSYRKPSRQEEEEPLSDSELNQILKKVYTCNDNVVVAEWSLVKPNTALQTIRKEAAREDDDDEEEEDSTLIVENGICFGSPECCGIRELRCARLTFIAFVVRTVNYLHFQQRRRTSDEPARPFMVLDVSELDFSFCQATLQSTVDLGLRGESQCHISYVPLTDEAARTADDRVASFARMIVEQPGKALQSPLAGLPLNYFDLGSFTVFIDLPSPSGKFVSTKRRGPNSLDPAHRHNYDRHAECAEKLARALASLRRGACMLVTFVPTPASIAAVYREAMNERRAEVIMEYTTVNEAKTCVTRAIAQIGRWGYVIDEVLPSVDCPQGSALSLMVTLDR
ncbi:hypothetical protein AGDE_12316 [Angomonas deanei]|nr:hypothetical protein AGDE_12316 [Angomonas deanei]|eukprot:EPY24499.1 hypothetical protein AGDE_12316 [Angomonas deanei]